MRYRTIAGTDIEVSEVGFGVWTVSTGWWGNVSDTEAVTLLRQAFDRGITFFDTADTYGNGRGETILAQAFPGADRDDIVVATKFGYDWQSQIGKRREGHREAPHCFEPAFLERALEGSLRRLGTDHIDCYQVHNARMEHLLNDYVWTFLDKARQAGKVRSVGIALGPAIGWLDPGRALIAAAREHGKSLLVRVPHSSGMLEGAYTIDTVFDENDHRRHRPRSWLVNGLKKIEQLDFLTEATRGTLGQAALRYILKDDVIASTFPNIYGLPQIEEFVGASDCVDVDPPVAARVEELYEANYGLPREQEAARPTRSPGGVTA